ncbi:MarR family winged helix-turn-helix transcriptional regulator [Pseudarthrobacter sp. L19]|uniref:MarR family winged helix-turn-helix transcriptional regulator n=1 Tax=Pseudarthrobacter sp. L19 TaxID=3423951 RepID=UPI003D7B46CA
MSADVPPQGGPGEPSPLVRLLQEFSLEANRYVDAAGARNDMHRTDLNALSVIMEHTAKNQVVTPGVLRRELHLSSPATTALIDRLDRSGHVVREREGTDRRQVQLRMTAKAFDDGGAMFLPLARHMGAAMERFTPEELEVATRFLTAMISATVRAGEEAAGSA